MNNCHRHAITMSAVPPHIGDDRDEIRLDTTCRRLRGGRSFFVYKAAVVSFCFTHVSAIYDNNAWKSRRLVSQTRRRCLETTNFSNR